MNVIKDYNTLVCLPLRQGARNIGSFFIRHFGMVNAWNGEARVTHNDQIPEEMSDFQLIMTVRNPYERFLSIAAWKRDTNVWDGDFERLANEIGNYYKSHRNLLSKVNHWIRTENITEDLLEIPFVKAREVELKNEIDQFDKFNAYKSKDRAIDELEKYQSVIYEKAHWVFDKFNYDKDSYKHIKN